MFYIGKRNTARKKVRKLLLFFLSTLIAFILFLNLRIYPLISSYAYAKLQTTLTEKINSSVSRQLIENKNMFRNLVTLSTKNDGSVSSMNVNNAELLAARAMLVSDILKSVNYHDKMHINIPAGNISGINFLSGRGPDIKIYTDIANGFNAYFENEFSELGINQTLYRIIFTVSFKIDILLPSKIETVTIIQSFPVMSTVIIGDVPDAYTEITRLTEDITESEIDDIYDFGASTSQ